MTSPHRAADPVQEGFRGYGRTRTRTLTVSGREPLIVLLHGFADTADTWRGVLTELAREGRSALAVDLAGFGAADPFSPGPLMPQLDAFVDDLLADAGPAVLVGNSLGVALSLRAAQRNPLLVNGVLALDEPLLSNDWLARLARTRFAQSAAPLLRHLPVPDPLVRRLLEIVSRYLLFGRPRVADRAIISAWGDKYGTIEAVSWLADYAVRFAHESVAGYTGIPITCPARIVHGARDRIIPVQASRDLHRRLPGSELIVLPRAGHCPQLDDPVEITELLTDFIDHVISRPQDEAG